MDMIKTIFKVILSLNVGFIFVYCVYFLALYNYYLFITCYNLRV